MPVLPKPTTKPNWTAGNPSFGTVTIEPSAGKKLAGWAAGERPPHQTMNWIHWITQEWTDYLESITDDHETRIDTVETTITNLGLAANITASQVGHTYALGGTVQLQLDAIDTFLEDLANAVTNGQGADLLGYVVGTPSDWNATIPDHVGNALDQLASRVRSLENTSNVGLFVGAVFDDHVIAPTNNTGLTDNINTNPRGLKLNDLKYVEGHEIIYCDEIALTGNADANGLPEWEIVSPKKDNRVRFYGGGWGKAYHDSNGHRVFLGNSAPVSGGNYFLVTGVFDAIALDIYRGGAQMNDMDVLVDGVDTGVNLDCRSGGIFSAQGGYKRAVSTLSDASLRGLGMDLHTVKFIAQSTDADINLNLYAIHLAANATAKQLGGSAYVSKNATNYVVSTPALPTFTSKGGRVDRYIDTTDTLIKNTVQNATVIETQAPSVGSGATTISVNDAAGFQAGDLIYITDGPNNSELLRATSVNQITDVITVATATVNSYTNATVGMYGRTGAGVNHSNEEVYRHAYWRGWDINSYWGSNVQGPATHAYGVTAGQGSNFMDDGATMFNYSSSSIVTGNNGGKSGIRPSAVSQVMCSFYFVGTGLDILFSTGSPISATFTAFIDGVELTAPTYPADKGFWQKIVSDLPEGSHHFQLQNNAGNGPVDIQEFKVYRTKKSSTAAAVLDGNKIMSKFKTASYRFQFRPAGLGHSRFTISQGVVRQHVSKFCYIENGTGGSVSWEGVGAGPEFHTQDTRALNYAQTNRTNAKIGRWFYGTGVDVVGFTGANYGISQIKINGNNATVANFPGATFHSTGSFNSSTGLWDSYIPSGVQMDKVGISNLGLGWHYVEVINTGTKNPGSSDFFLVMVAFDIHGYDYAADILYGLNPSPLSLVATHYDQRKFDPIKQLEFEVSRFAKAWGILFTPNYGTGPYHVLEGMHVVVETKEGEDLEVDLIHSFYTNATNQNVSLQFEIDGQRTDVISNGDDTIYGNGHAATTLNPVSKKEIFTVPPGIHTITALVAVGSSSFNSYGISRRLFAKAVPRIKGGK